MSEIVGQVNGVAVMRDEMTMAFNAVAPKDNWKMPIDTTVDLDPFTMALVKEAVVFFTGSVPTFELVGGTTTGRIGKYKVKAAGYYNTIGA